jgi:hypothetical protein
MAIGLVKAVGASCHDETHGKSLQQIYLQVLYLHCTSLMLR